MSNEPNYEKGCKVMQSSLRDDRRGVGTIIGAAFVLIIILTGYTYYMLQMDLTNSYNKVLMEMQELDLRQSKESIEILSVSFNAEKLNMTIKNTGPNLTHLIWLGIFDETLTPHNETYYQINFYANPGETTANIGNNTIPSFEEQERVIQIVTDHGNTYYYNYPLETTESEDSEYDFVDTEGDPPTIGNHSLFSAQQLGPDGIVDTLIEVNTTPEQWVSPTGYEDPGSEWTGETNAYDDNTGTYAVSDVPGGDTWSNYLVLTNNATICGRIRYYIGRESDLINQVEIDIYNGSWINVYSDTGIWNTWTNVSFTETSVTKMRFRFFNDHAFQARMAYVYEADFLLSETVWEMDLEVQWTNADYDETNEWLSIYGGTMGSEDLRVDVWNDTGWVTVLTDLGSGWNSVDVSSYLTSSTFKIRFRDTMRTGDITQDSWEIDTSFLLVWT